MHLEELFKAGKLLIRTVGEPGTQGAGVTGTHGMGVKTPSFAAVAAITTGLAGLLHVPNGLILAIGTKSIIVHTGGPPAMTGGPFGIGLSTLGAAPKLHMMEAPVTTWMPISALYPLFQPLPPTGLGIAAHFLALTVKLPRLSDRLARAVDHLIHDLAAGPIAARRTF
jgi:hypothetical protein